MPAAGIRSQIARPMCPGCQQQHRVTEGPTTPACLPPSLLEPTAATAEPEPPERAPAASRRLFAAAPGSAQQPSAAPRLPWQRRRRRSEEPGPGGRMVRGGGVGGMGRARRFPDLGRGEPRRGLALTRLRSAFCSDALSGQAGRGGYPAAGRQAEEEREEGAAAGRSPGPEGLHRRDSLAGGNGCGGGRDSGPRAQPAPWLSRFPREIGTVIARPLPDIAAGREEPFPCRGSPSPLSAAAGLCCGTFSPPFAEPGLACEGCLLLPSEV